MYIVLSLFVLFEVVRKNDIRNILCVCLLDVICMTFAESDGIYSVSMVLISSLIELLV